jgi:acetylornithine deacetylase/succinyl-diaminopimelate desuccinylase-like protein
LSSQPQHRRRVGNVAHGDEERQVSSEGDRAASSRGREASGEEQRGHKDRKEVGHFGHQIPERTGGTIPVVATFTRLLKVPCLLLGIGLPDENAHAPNEKLDLDNLHHGMLSAVHLWNELAELKLPKS